ncbi:hypothetical protein ACVWZA_000664 [Sphingomonas sp. UYAg733]
MALSNFLPIERRALFGGVLGGLLLPVAGGKALASVSAGTTDNRPWYDLDLMSDPVMNSQLLHVLGATYGGLADVGEVLDTATRIDPRDEWSWPRQWTATARRIEAMAELSLARGKRISAGKAYRRAAMYYRAALLHHPDAADPSDLEIARSAANAYHNAIGALDIAAVPIRARYEGGHLPGYFMRSPHARGDAPLLILQQGRDAWPESAAHLHDDALARGYHVLFVHSPGQGLALRQWGFAFRPDWEKVISPIVDVAIRIAGVDRKRIALLGWSMGGALVPRAAAFEKRIRLVVANPGVLDWGSSTFAQYESYFPDLLPLLDRDPDRFDVEMRKHMATDPLVRWYIKDAMAKHGVATPSQLLYELRLYTNVPVVEKIRARTLVMDGTGEMFSVGQARALFDALRCPKDYILFDARDTGLLHCQEAAGAVSDHRLFDWIDEYI